ncbi:MULTISPECIES: phage recombination protein Bet [unclassified Acinetobacter]|uniref:phage recombination protein Bet n=1 Tax=unclassified Acinetobacter TaxID=196816 RepID=UPI00211E1E54|nr:MULTISPECIES: phage recombination protein Bet [unclassified Acinetobacter]
MQLAEVLGLHNVDPQELKQTLIQTAFKSDKEITDAQMGALMIVASQYKLNPWTKEIYAFPDKKGIIPVVGVDGWSRIINSNSNLNGIEFAFSENLVLPNKAKVKCPEWVDCIIHRKDRDHPTVVREYLDEVYREPLGQNGYAGPWQSHPKRFLRHKALIQCARLAFGYVGIYDQDEAERIQENSSVKTVQGHTENAVPDGYMEFETEHLAHFKSESQYGSERLQAAYISLPKGDCKKHFWTTHSVALKQVAELADQALARQGETYDHSPA